MGDSSTHEINFDVNVFDSCEDTEITLTVTIADDDYDV